MLSNWPPDGTILHGRNWAIRTQYLHCGPVLSKQFDLPAGNPKSILVKCTGGLGDTINSIYFIHNLRNAFPTVSVLFVFNKESCDTTFLQWLFNCYSIDLLCQDAVMLPSVDIAFNLNPFDDGDVAPSIHQRTVALSPQRGAYAVKKCSHPVMKAYEYLSLLNVLGINTQMAYTPPDTSTLPSVQHTAICRRPYGVICPHASVESWNMPDRLIKQLTNRLVSNVGAMQVVILGTCPRDRATRPSQNGRENLPNGSRCHDLRNRTSLCDAALYLSNATWVVSVDSGLMHLASFLGTPTLGVFAPGSPERQGPQGIFGAALSLQIRPHPTCTAPPHKAHKHCDYCRQKVKPSVVLRALDVLTNTNPNRVEGRMSLGGSPV